MNPKHLTPIQQQLLDWSKKHQKQFILLQSLRLKEDDYVYYIYLDDFAKAIGREDSEDLSINEHYEIEDFLNHA